MVSIPFIDLEVAASTGRRVVPAGPELERAEIAELVASLRASAEASVAPVAEVTRLTVPVARAMPVVDRPTWLRANVDMVATMLAEASGRPLPQPGSVREQVEARVNGAQLGIALAALGTRILGQFLPFAATPHLLLVAPNVAKVERQLGVNRSDFRLWVCLHEQTHRLQFAQAPWLRGHLLQRLGTLLSPDEPVEPVETTRRQRPSSLIDVITTPQQKVVFDEISAVMALLEGYADDMMDRVGPEVVPTVAAIRRTFDAHRQRGGFTRVLNKTIGLDLKLAQYRDGAAFCRAVINRVGVDGLNAVYAGPDYLPGPAEITNPALWVGRVHG